MKPSLLMMLSASLLLAVPARAGINLAWDDCGTAGADRIQFACDTNVGLPFTLVGSVTPNQPWESIVGASARIAIMGTQAQLPDWWKFGSGSCRGTGALLASFDFADSGPYTCADPWNARAWGTLDYQIVSATDARIQLACAMPDGETTSLDAGTQYYVFKLKLARSRSTGADACAGCSMAACLLLQDISLYRADHFSYSDQVGQDRQFCSWHSASLGTWDDFEHGTSGIACVPDLPTRTTRSTWGMLKSLYR